MDRGDRDPISGVWSFLPRLLWSLLVILFLQSAVHAGEVRQASPAAPCAAEVEPHTAVVLLAVKWREDHPIRVTLYAYVGGDPVGRWDPLGLDWMDYVGAGLGMVGGALQVAAGVTIGVTLGWTGVGAVAGAALIAKGVADTALSLKGLHDALNGYCQGPTSLFGAVANMVAPDSDFIALGFDILDVFVTGGLGGIGKGSVVALKTAQLMKDADQARKLALFASNEALASGILRGAGFSPLAGTVDAFIGNAAWGLWGIKGIQTFWNWVSE